MIKIFNTLTRKKEVFIPTNNNVINIYVCGVTVYDLCHIGHGRTFTVFDMIFSYLKYCGHKLNYIRNITDIDDKIIQKAKQNNESIKILTSRIIKNMKKDFLYLKISLPNYEPRVTNHIKEIIEMIKKLILLKFAYIGKGGNVLFSIKKFKDYGNLSFKNFNKLTVNQEDNKDFTLWKITKNNDEPKWKSPWGNGRPGWHIECSAISYKYLGDTIDIHGGGCDLIFPHHENEIAQSFCANKQRVNYWIHSGLIMNDKKKMSKSLNNFFTIRDISKFSDSESLRYYLLSSHYRSTLNFSKKELINARLSLGKIYNSLTGTDLSCVPSSNKKNCDFEIKFINAMNDDFNTPKVYSIFFSMVHEINKLKLKNFDKANDLAAKLRQLANIIGLLKKEPESFLKNKIVNDNDKIKRIKLLIKIRASARKLKQWEKADDIRKQLKKMGVSIEDTLSKTIWKSK